MFQHSETCTLHIVFVPNDSIHVYITYKNLMYD